MLNNELVSIIIPVYNVERTLNKCLVSVINQTYKNLEIIIVDDGSSDKSSHICDDYKTSDSRIKVIHKKNGGLSDARNYGLDIATGKYIAFVDSDDEINVRFIETLYNLQQEYDADIVSCSYKKYYLDSEININESVDKIKLFSIIRKNKNCIKEYLYRTTKINIYHSVWSKLYKRELFNELRFNVGKYHEDLFITYKLLNRCKCLVATDLPLYYYFKDNKDSICSTYGVKNFIDQCDALIEIYNSLNSDVEIKNELSYFIVNNAVNVYLLSFKEKLGKDICKQRKRIKGLINKNISNLSFTNKIKTVVKLVFPRAFVKS